MSTISPQNDMVHAIKIRMYLQKATNFINNMTLSEFEANEEKQYAAAHAVEQAGEHVKKLSQHFREAMGEVEWKNVAGMRDCIVHDYEGIDMELLYTSVVRDAPKVVKLLSEYISNNESLYTDTTLDFTRIRRI